TRRNAEAATFDKNFLAAPRSVALMNLSARLPSTQRPLAVPASHLSSTVTRSRRSAFVVAVALCLLARTSGAEEPIEKRMDDLFGEHERYLAFFQTLKDSVVRDDRKTVAKLLHYPLDVVDE